MPPQVVIDTNIVVAAFRSRRGASYRLLSLLGDNRFEINLSVPLTMEYEDVLTRAQFGFSNDDIQHVIDYICAVSNLHEVYFLWRPFLTDPKDDMVLELAVTARCQYIITYNQRDFRGCETFGLEAIRPREFLDIIKEIP